MTDDVTSQSQSLWPTAKFSFLIKWGDAELIFQEVTGFSGETQNIEYRGSKSKDFSPVKMPSLQKFSNVTLKRGVFKGNKALWYKYNKLNTANKSGITISLLNESNTVAMTWTLTNALPVKIMATDLKSDANEVAIEIMELSHEGITLST
jgi:phage tail-like protein